MDDKTKSRRDAEALLMKNVKPSVKKLFKTGKQLARDKKRREWWAEHGKKGSA